VPRGIASFHDRPATSTPHLSWAGRLCGEVVGRVVASSDAVRDALLRQRWVPPGKTVVIPDGVDLARFDRPGEREAAREHWGSDGATRLVGGIVSAEDEAGLPLLLEAFEIVADALPDTRFLVCGARGEGNSRPGRVRFLGPHADSPAFFRAIDHLCLPHADRVVPLTLLEALAASVPVTAGVPESDAGLAPEGPWAFAQLTADEPRALAAGAIELLDDPQAAQALVRPGHRCVRERFSLEAHVARVQALYDSID
jgi:glycosyltransferase involved in cell wall biosynthesis